MGSANGPVVMVKLDLKAPYVSFQAMLGIGTQAGGTGIRAHFYDANGNFVKKEDYTERMTQYVENMDPTAGVYPLTKDLKYILESHGNYAGWYDSTDNGYLFKDSDNNPIANVNKEYAWMFACCYVPAS